MGSPGAAQRTGWSQRNPLRRVLGAAIDLRPGEGILLGLLFLHALIKGLSTVFFETAANTRFLVDFSVDLLPWIYIATAVASVVLGLAYVRAERSSSPIRLFVAVLMLLILVTAVFYALLLLDSGPWISLLLMVWGDVHWVLFEIEFWAVAALVFNIRQSKRLLGPLAAGSILGYVLGGVLTPAVVALLGTNHLLGLSLVCSIVCLGLLLRIHRDFSESFQPTEALESEAPGDDSRSRELWNLLRRRYVLLILTITTASILAYYLLDFFFYQQVQAQFPEESEIANFFGLFAAVYGIASLATSGMFTGRILARFGIVAALLTIPVTGLAGVAAAVLVLDLGLWPALVFWLIVTTKLTNEVLSEAVQAPTFRILYQPLASNERLKVLAVRESVVMPAAGGLAGALLLVMTQVFDLAIRELAFFYLAFAVVTIGLVFLIRREYLQALARSVRRRLVGGEDLDLSDPASLEVLRRGLDSVEPRDVINCLRLLEEADHRDLIENLTARLGHDDPAVRRYALERLEALAPAEARTPLETRLDAEPDEGLRGLALRAFAAAAGETAIERIAAFLDDEGEDLRLAAVTALLRHGGLGGVLAVSARLNGMIANDDPKQRADAARALADSGVAGFYHPLLALLRDDDARVRQSAASAAGRLRHPRLIKPLIAALGDPAQRAAAETALLAFGGKALPAVVAAFEAARNEDERIRLMRLAARLDEGESNALLIACLPGPRHEVRHVALRLLATQGRPRPSLPPGQLESLLDDEVEGLLANLAALRGLAEEGAARLLRSALAREIDGGRDRILLLLALDRPDPLLRRAHELLLADETALRAQGLEILDNLLPRDRRADLLPLFDDITPAEALSRVPRAAPKIPGKHGSVSRWVLEERRHGPWAMACALVTARQDHAPATLAAVRKLVRDPHPLVRETAAWVLLSRGDGDAGTLAADLEKDVDPAVARLAAAWRSGRLPAVPLVAQA